MKTNKTEARIYNFQEDIETLFQNWEKESKRNLIDYKFHVYRVWNLCLKLANINESYDQELFRILAITSAFHDSEYFIYRNWDYLEPSNIKLKKYLESIGLSHQSNLASLCLMNHHLMKVYRGPHFRVVESFRKADLIDFPGIRRHGIDPYFLKQLRIEYPYMNFRIIVWWETIKQFLKSPFSGLPMLRKNPYLLTTKD